MITVKTIIQGTTIRFRFSKPVANMTTDEIRFHYPFDVSACPEHVANFMLGILLCEPVGWQSEVVELGQLTEREQRCINDHAYLSAFVNCFQRVDPMPGRITSLVTVPHEFPKSDGPILSTNGMGKDGTVLTALLAELGVPFIPVTFAVQYADKRVWMERYRTTQEFYRTLGISGTVVYTNHMQAFDFIVIPWWVMLLPMAWVMGSRAVLSAHALLESKVLLRNYLPERVYNSLMSITEIGRAVGIPFESPMSCTDFHTPFKLLAERYPEFIKYQRTCMYGMPNCGQCPICNVVSVHYKAAGLNPAAYGLPAEPLLPKLGILSVRDSCVQAGLKAAGKPYRDRFEMGSNEAWQHTGHLKDKFRAILSQHIQWYDGDDGPDGFGETSVPSLWGGWLGAGRDRFWAGDTMPTRKE